MWLLYKSALSKCLLLEHKEVNSIQDSTEKFSNWQERNNSESWNIHAISYIHLTSQHILQFLKYI